MLPIRSSTFYTIILLEWEGRTEEEGIVVSLDNRKERADLKNIQKMIGFTSLPFYFRNKIC
ncbi:hypothetical protein [Chryseobacterium fistulae]|uniref:hypothetical protein n=1 Tax=Chryseobacterium fistulae TaxID=2675058 RepID=UPI001E40A988|nr:hypothetical protein [Chryseobacterium fistulae]